MKTIFVLGFLMSSTVAMAADCTEDLRKFIAMRAATEVELINMGEPALTKEVIPMNAQDVYKIRFSYSGVQHSWRVYVDDFSCEIKSVTK